MPKFQSDHKEDMVCFRVTREQRKALLLASRKYKMTVTSLVQRALDSYPPLQNISGRRKAK